MRKYIVFFVLNLFILSLEADNFLHSKVDERFELTSIVFRLIDADEYVNNDLETYAKDIDVYFTPYKNHPLIKYTKDILRDRDEIGYDAVASSTTLLVIEKGNVKLNPKADISKYVSVDYRWKEETLKQYVKLLNDFYKKTKFREFFKSHAELYSIAENRFDELLKEIDINWFEDFFGKSFGSPKVYLSLCNGRSNYALWDSYLKDAPDEYGIVIGAFLTDEDKTPFFPNKRSITTTIIHEFGHRFTNPLMEKYADQMVDGAQKIYPYVKEQLKAVAYGNANVMLGEGFNNLFVNMYYKEHPAGFEKYTIAEHERFGFVWMNRAVNFAENFYINREVYPTINEFMPQLVDFFNFTASNIKSLMKEYKMKAPQVINVFPALDSEVDSDIKEIRVEFSHRMWGSMGVYPLNDSIFISPISQGDHWSKDMKMIVFPVSLEKNTKYGLKLPKGAYLSEDTYPMLEDFEVRFKTKE
ncbi:DUF4932 domain-containing protein [Dysgonomonas sp. 216]|uniref:DUF4932 domain-containing protein n=1 Tax=Dysgonomonas sp. 216 TaxID=2302934 RepID=UPI0013D651AC|nr:DUF4932 domain-containing protein [Dysgonomonas sp. 216]NDW18130.1 DUF4932 domain-containing protein [Dysgonomonas sp. 216]